MLAGDTGHGTSYCIYKLTDFFPQAKEVGFPRSGEETLDVRFCQILSDIRYRRELKALVCSVRASQVMPKGAQWPMLMFGVPPEVVALQFA